MTDPASSPDDDLQRPLDEGWPEGLDERWLTADGPAARPPAAELSGEDVVTQLPVEHAPTDLPAGDPAGDPPEPAPPPDPVMPQPVMPEPVMPEPVMPEPTTPLPTTTPLRPAVPLGAATPQPAEPSAAGTAIRSHRATAPLALVARGRLVQVVHALRRLPGRAARGLGAWARRPSGRLALPGSLITAMLVAGALGGAMVVPASGDEVSAGPGATAAPTGAPGASPAATGPPLPVPPFTTPDLIHPGNPTDSLRDWADEMAARTDIPVIAVLAYGYAELVVANTTPECNLQWTTLAAIGRVESGHGHTGDSRLLPDGRAVPPIVGDPLDGQGGRQLIPDTDGGDLDGDSEYDRAVGPMQFIPETWRIEAVDATGDGVADIHNIHDAALAAANYLCRGGRDLATAADWWAAIHAYNNVSVYADAVFAAANDYGQRSRQP